MSNRQELIMNLDKIHTTELGVLRIRKNLSLDTDDVVGWCKERVRIYILKGKKRQVTEEK